MRFFQSTDQAPPPHHLGQPDGSQDPKRQFTQLIEQQSKLYSFLMSPEAYLLCAGILSALVTVPLIGLNIMALSCLASSCPALDQDSNTVVSWLIFEVLTAFFVGTTILPIRSFLAIRRQRNSQENG